MISTQCPQSPVLYTFVAFYKGKQTIVTGETSYKAQQTAATYFKAKKAYDVTVMRADIVHSTSAI